MRSFRRSERVSATVQRILSSVIGRDIRDPRVSMVVVTRVEMNDDLRIATVFFQLIGQQVDENGPAVKEAVKGLEAAKGYLRRELGAELQIKFTPDLRFVFDTSLSTMLRINEILANVRPSDS